MIPNVTNILNRNQIHNEVCKTEELQGNKREENKVSPLALQKVKKSNLRKPKGERASQPFSGTNRRKAYDAIRRQKTNTNSSS